MPRKRSRRQQSAQQGASQQVLSQGASSGSGVARPGTGRGQAAESGGLMGWFRDAGQWVGDKASGAAEAVGDWARDTKDAARELWEAAASTDFAWKDGQISLETDLDEVLDVVPGDLRQGLALDRAGADNRVKVTLDTNTRELVITSDALVIESYESESLSTGTISLSGVRVVLSNHQGGLPFLGGDFSVLGYEDKDDQLAAQFTVASASASSVEWRGDGGPVSVASLQLTGLTGDISSGPALPGAEGAKTEVGFDLEGAVLEGLRSEGHVAESITVGDASGGLSQSGESAFLEAGSVDVKGAAAGTEALGAASAQGVRIDVDNRGGGAPFVDGVKDRARARVAVEAASLSDFDGASADLDAASVAGLRASYDTTTGGGSLFAQDLQASGLDSSWVDVNSLDLDDAGVDFGRTDSGSRVDLRAARASTDGLQIDAPEGGGSDGSPPLDWSAELGALDLRNTQAAGASIATATGRGVHASGRADGAGSTYGARAQELAVGGVDHALLQAGALSGSNVGLQGDAQQVGVTSDRLSGSDISAAAFEAAQLDGYGLDARMGSGSAALRLERARMAEARIADRVSVDGAGVDGLVATHDNGVNTVSLDHAAVSGLRDDTTGATLGSAELSGARTAGTLDRFDTTIDQASVRDLSAPGLGLESGTLTALQASRADGTFSGGLGAAELTGLSVADRASADQASLTGLSASTDGTAHSLRLERASATGLADATTDSAGQQLSVQGLDASLQDGALRARLNGLSGAGLRQGDSSLAELDAGGLRLNGGGAAWSGGVDRLRASELAMGDTLQSTALRGDGLAFDTNTDRTLATASHLGADGLAFQADGSSARVDSLGLDGLGLTMDGQGTRGGAERVQASGLGLQSSGGGGGSIPGLDTARLTETLASRVQYADARVQGDLQAGELGGGLSARRGTSVDAQLRVRNNQLVPGANSARFSQALDGPLWTGVNGVDLNPKGKLKADVTGWFDQDVTGTLNESLGRSGKSMPSVGQIGTGVAGIMRQPSSGASGGSPVHNLRGSASVGLYGGEIDAGRAGGVTLDHARQAGDNQLDARFGPGGMDLAVRRFLARTARLDTGERSVQTGPAAVTGVDAQTRGDRTSATIDGVDLHDLSFSDDTLRR